MKKLTAGIFTVLMALVSANGANAAIATQGYVDQEVGKVQQDANTNAAAITEITKQGGTIDTKAGKALDDAKEYVDSKITKFSDETFSATAGQVESNKQAIEGLLDTVADMDGAYKAADQTLQGNIDTLSGTVSTMDGAYKAADTTLQGNIDTLSGTVSGMDAAYKAADTKIREDFAAADATTLADAKKYADDQDAAQTTTITAAYKLADTNLETSLKQYADEKAAAASGDASEVASDLAEYKTANNAAVKAADDKAVAAQGEVDALEIVVATNKSETDAAILDITKTDGTIDTKVKASADVLEGKIAAANTAAGNAETNAKAYALEKSNAALTAAVGYTDTVIANMNLSDISRVPAACADTTNYCSLTTNGTNFIWEVIKRADGETVKGTPVTLTEAAVTAKPETLK